MKTVPSLRLCLQCKRPAEKMWSTAKQMSNKKFQINKGLIFCSQLLEAVGRITQHTGR